MKIQFVIHSLASGGAERVTATLANLWVASGHQVSILTIADQDSDFYSLSPAVRRIALNAAGSSAGPGGGFGRVLRRILAIRRQLRANRPDVAVGMMTTASCMLALAAIGTGVPTVGAERIHPPRFALRPPWAWLRRRVYRYLSAVVAQTSRSADWLRANTRPSSVAVIPNPVIYPLPSGGQELPPSELNPDWRGRPLLLAVGRLAEQKGFDLLLEAFARLAADFPDWRLVILGEGDQRAELERQVAASGLEDKVIMPGAVGNAGDWYKAASAYVMSSRYEGFPNTLLEAMAHGLPVISTDCETGPADIISDGEDGLLVAEGDTRSLEAGLRTLMSDAELRASLAAKAIRVRDRFAEDIVSEQWLELFHAVADSDREPPR